MLQHSRQASLPQMVPPNSSPLTTALNAPMVAPPTLAPLAALLNPEVSFYLLLIYCLQIITSNQTLMFETVLSMENALYSPQDKLR